MSLFNIFNRKTCSRQQERSGLGLVRWNPSGPAILELAPIRKNNLGISGVERLRTPVTGILIVGLTTLKVRY